MKARTKCPKCKHDFITNVPNESKKCESTCPKCNHKFQIQQSADESKTTKECGWEEHGEPRKTILSALKPHTSKPMMASFLLLASCVLGIFTATLLYSSTNIFIPYLNIKLNFLTDFLSNFGLSIVIGIFSIFSFVGFISALKRRYIKVAAACAFLSIFSIGFFVGSILSIVALILIILAKEEFEDGTKGKVF